MNIITKHKPVVGITMGDPSGIGPEIIIKVISLGKIHAFCQPIVIGNPSVIQQNIKNMGLDLKLEIINNPGSESSPEIMRVIPVEEKKAYSIDWGKPNAEGGRLSRLAVYTGVQLALEGKLDAITTAPVNKKAINMAGFAFSGHTEYLAQLTETTQYAMLLAAGGFRVLLVTTHHALKEVPRLIKKDAIFEKIKIAHEHGFFWELKKPRIAVCALNPHSGDGGIFGTEEESEILPAIKAAQEIGILAEGPIASDTLFTEHRLCDFDMVVAMYHDQGLIPLKMKSFGSGINITLGLPIIRTSVDHGTAYNIAGRGVANPASLECAISMAVDICEHKKNFKRELKK